MRYCPVCHTTDALTIHTQQFANGQSQLVKRCHNCGMIYADSSLTQAAYDTTYREHSKYVAMGTAALPEDITRHRETMRELHEYLTLSSSILDIGCATGQLLQVFKDVGFTNLTGYDPSPQCREAARKRGIQTVDTAFVGHYDCVILSHVLEHIYDVRQAMANIVAMMTSTSVLYIEVPDAARYDTSSGPFQEFNTEHVNHFTWQTLVELGRRWGLSVLKGATKTFPVGDGRQYEALWMVFAKERIFGYIEASQAQMQRIEEQLEHELADVSSVVIWGAGQLAYKLLMLPVFNDMSIVIWDNNEALHGWLHGWPVTSPGGRVGEHDPIVVASILNAESIKRQIAAMGLKNRVVTLV